MDQFNNNQPTGDPAATGGTQPQNPPTEPTPAATPNPAPAEPPAATPAPPVNDGTPTMDSGNPQTPAPAEKDPMVSKPVMIFAVIVLIIILGLLAWRFFLQDMFTDSDTTADANVTITAEAPEATLTLEPTQKKT